MEYKEMKPKLYENNEARAAWFPRFLAVKRVGSKIKGGEHG
jgi:hypothetical protein